GLRAEPASGRRRSAAADQACAHQLESCRPEAGVLLAGAIEGSPRAGVLRRSAPLSDYAHYQHSVTAHVRALIALLSPSIALTCGSAGVGAYASESHESCVPAFSFFGRAFAHSRRPARRDSLTQPTEERRQIADGGIADRAPRALSGP